MFTGFRVIRSKQPMGTFGSILMYLATTITFVTNSPQVTPSPECTTASTSGTWWKSWAKTWRKPLVAPRRRPSDHGSPTSRTICGGVRRHVAASHRCFRYAKLSWYVFANYYIPNGNLSLHCPLSGMLVTYAHCGWIPESATFSWQCVITVCGLLKVLIVDFK